LQALALYTHSLTALPAGAAVVVVAAAVRSVVADVVDTLAATGGNALKLVHTHDGAAAAAMALSYGTPKDRKRLVKGMKGES
jgi:pumilio family protein 6